MKVRQRKTREKVVDCFAGGGGTSCGIKLATGRSPDAALNHNEAAMAMHRANHPKTVHYREDVWRRRPEDLIADGDTVGLGTYSPDCRFFSNARGGAPSSARVRALAWSVVWHAKRIRPRIMIVENVREMQKWGPLCSKAICPTSRFDHGFGNFAPCDWSGAETSLKDGRCPRCGTTRVRLDHKHRVPNPKKCGQTFKAWIRALKREGYVVAWRVLNAADHGAPTHRRRLFIIARRDGEPIEWPEQTHASPENIAELPLIYGQMTPYRTAAECIDFTPPTRSIFDRGRWKKNKTTKAREWVRTKDLAEKTQLRIAKGFMRFVVNNPKPYIVRIGQQGGNGDYTKPIDDPLSTVTTKAEHCVAVPSLVKINHGRDANRSQGVDVPIGAVTSKHGHAIQDAELAPVYLVQTGYGERNGQEPRAIDPDKPLGTVVGTGKHAAVAVFLTRFFGDKSGVVGKQVDAPLPTVTGCDHHAIVGATLVGMGGPTGAGKPRPVDAPANSVLCEDHRGLAAIHLVKFRHDSQGADVSAPMPTVTAGAGAARPAGAAHALGIAAVHLSRFNGKSVGSEADDPAPASCRENHDALAAVYVAEFHGGQGPQSDDISKPIGAVNAQGNKFALVFAWLMKYHGTAIGSPLDEPAHTVDANDRYALVKVFVETSPGIREPAVMLNVPGIGPCLVSDIHLRMLVPRELANCQSFPASYILTGSNESQVARIGNSVPPVLMAALVRANYRPRKVPA